METTIIRNCVGPQIIDISDQFTWDEEVDEKKPDKLFEKPIDSGTSNIRNHSTNLRTRALSCNFLLQRQNDERQNCIYSSRKITRASTP